MVLDYGVISAVDRRGTLYLLGEDVTSDTIVLVRWESKFPGSDGGIEVITRHFRGIVRV
jgi:hypothetical protein